MLYAFSARHANTALLGTTMKMTYKNLSQLDVFMALTITELYSAVQAIKPVTNKNEQATLCFQWTKTMTNWVTTNLPFSIDKTMTNVEEKL